MWTQPETDEQRRYFSKHALKRKWYGIIMTVLQAGHGAIAFAAWFTIYAWAFSRVPWLEPVAPWLAGLSLVIFHVLFRVTWSTFWYDKLDNDERTDSSPFIPLAILALLLITEVQGARHFLENQIEPPQVASTAPVDSANWVAFREADRQYAIDSARIAATYAPKLAAAKAPHDAAIRNLRRRPADTAADRARIAGQIADEKLKRDQAAAAVEQEKSAALELALKGTHDRKTVAVQRYDREVLVLQEQNDRERQRYQAELDSVSSYAWLISVVLLGLIAALGYAQVRINVKSGILPLRNYTVLDAHGSLPERLWTALADALNRRGLQLATWLHRALSPRGAITSFDGTVVAKPGTYNTPEPERFYRQLPRTERPPAITGPVTLRPLEHNGHDHSLGKS